MAISQGKTGAGQTPAATEAIAFDSEIDQLTVTTMCVRNRAAAAGSATVRIPRLHGTTVTVGATIAAGEREYFRVDDGGIDKMYIDGSSALVDWYPVASTKS